MALRVLIISWLFANQAMAVTSVMAGEVRVAVASNFLETMKSLVQAQSQRQADQAGQAGQLAIKVKIISGSTGKLTAQIRQGAPFDLFLAADDVRPKQLEKEKRIIPGTRRTYATGQLTLISRNKRHDLKQGRMLETDSYRHLAMANPRFAPYGSAAAATLKRFKLPGQVKIVYGENVNQVKQFVMSGNAELGFVSRSIWLSLKRKSAKGGGGANYAGSHWHVPAEYHPAIIQQCVRLTDTKAVRQFEAFLFSEAGRRLIAADGYSVPNK